MIIDGFLVDHLWLEKYVYPLITVFPIGRHLTRHRIGNSYVCNENNISFITAFKSFVCMTKPELLQVLHTKYNVLNMYNAILAPMDPPTYSMQTNCDTNFTRLIVHSKSEF